MGCSASKDDAVAPEQQHHQQPKQQDADALGLTEAAPRPTTLRHTLSATTVVTTEGPAANPLAGPRTESRRGSSAGLRPRLLSGLSSSPTVPLDASVRKWLNETSNGESEQHFTDIAVDPASPSIEALPADVRTDAVRMWLDDLGDESTPTTGQRRHRRKSSVAVAAAAAAGSGGEPGSMERVKRKLEAALARERELQHGASGSPRRPRRTASTAINRVS